MRILFAGTPHTAVPSLRQLIDDGHDIAGVLTRAPAPVGRKRILTPSPVHTAAEEYGLHVLTPRTLRDGAVEAEIKELAPEAVAIVAYGMIVPANLLPLAPHGWINLHFSLLPAWRGAAPVQYAIAAGDAITGATTFRLEEGLDTGPIFGYLTEAIGAGDTSGDVLKRLSVSGAQLLSRTLAALEAGITIPTPQEGEVSYAPTISSSDAEIAWNTPAIAVERRIRAHLPAPGPWTMLSGTRIKLGPVRICADCEALKPGQIVYRSGSVYVGTASAPVELTWMAPAGKRQMEAGEWAKGARLQGNAYFEGCHE